MRSSVLVVLASFQMSHRLNILPFSLVCWCVGAIFALVHDLRFPQAITSRMQSAGFEVFFAWLAILALAIGLSRLGAGRAARVVGVLIFLVAATGPFAREFARVMRLPYHVWKLNYVPLLAVLSITGPCARTKSEPWQQLTLCFQLQPPFDPLLTARIVARYGAGLPVNLYSTSNANTFSVEDRRALIRGAVWSQLSSEQRAAYDDLAKLTVGENFISPIVFGFYLYRVDETTG